MREKISTGLDNKRIAVNLVFSIMAFVLNLLINFFITPLITENLGSDAYGFVKLANDFTGYASLASIALNSMASRFIMLEREKGHTDEARQYYSSITVANMVLSVLLMLPLGGCVIFLDRLLNVPTAMLAEVRITFAVTFFAFLVNLCFSTFGNCYYLTNRLDINSRCTVQADILKVCCILGLFYILQPRVSFMAVGGLVSTTYLVAANIRNQRKLTPDLSFSFCEYRWERVRKVLASGIWNSITRLSQIFSSGLDLLVTNLMLGAQNMGYLSVAKTVPNLVASFNATVANVFSPNMMLLYAKGDMQELKKAAKSAMKFMCLFVTIPNAILITMGQEFFSLWVPTQPTQLISILAVLTIINSCITGPIQPLYQIFTITNKIKQSSIVLIIYGFSSILITYICLRTTELGLLAVAGVSLIGSVIVALLYHLPFAAIYIGLPWHTFFPEVFKGIFSLGIQCVIGWMTNLLLPLEKSWVMWFTGAVISAVIGLLLNVLLILDKGEKKVLAEMVVSKVRRKK